MGSLDKHGRRLALIMHSNLGCGIIQAVAYAIPELLEHEKAS